MANSQTDGSWGLYVTLFCKAGPSPFREHTARAESKTKHNLSAFPHRKQCNTFKQIRLQISVKIASAH